MSHKQLKRIEDYDKNLPIVEIYTAVQSEGSRAGLQVVPIGVSSEKVDGVIAGIQVYIQKKGILILKI